MAIPKTVTESRLAENMHAAMLRLTPDDMQRIGALDVGHRVGWGGNLVIRNGQLQPRDIMHPDYPFEWSARMMRAKL